MNIFILAALTNGKTAIFTDAVTSSCAFFKIKSDLLEYWRMFMESMNAELLEKIHGSCE